MLKRASGILIHPTSFPSPYGCGDLGDDAYKIIDWLKKSGQTILQVLPLGPTGFGDSPYQAFSSFAGTPYIISFDKLIEKGYLSKNDLSDYPKYEPKRVDYHGIYINNFKILSIAYNNFKSKRIPSNFKTFCEESDFWLEDYSTFMAIKDSLNGASWDCWPDEWRLRKKLDKFNDDIKDRINFYRFIQWQFSVQWHDFKKYAKENGISIIGDAPIFVSYDSADVWANQNIFHLHKDGKPAVVAGVPPDYFSETGQLWGNPHYRWDVMRNDDYYWWKKRIKHLISLVDCIRIDHFRGFEAYWQIKYGELTAVNGKWVKGPGEDFFNSLKNEFGEKIKNIIIAEDLGLITKEVKELRDNFGLPGMRIFEFAEFGDGVFTDDDNVVHDNKEHIYLPENYIKNSVAYPGTHDNDTLKGWFHSQDSHKQEHILNYLMIKDSKELNYAVIKKLMQSEAKWVITTMQDVLELYSDCRMNTPGTCGIHNWSWRLTAGMLKDEYSEKLLSIVNETGRI
jgi:4-alpha-glucanotransferase